MPTLIPMRRLAKRHNAGRSIEAFEIWAASLGTAAVACASFLYLLVEDGVAASFVLVAAAGLVLAFRGFQTGRLS